MNGTVIRVDVEHLPKPTARTKKTLWLLVVRTRPTRPRSVPALLPAPLRHRTHLPVHQEHPRLDHPVAVHTRSGRPLLGEATNRYGALFRLRSRRNENSGTKILTYPLSLSDSDQDRMLGATTVPDQPALRSCEPASMTPTQVVSVRIALGNQLIQPDLRQRILVGQRHHRRLAATGS